MPSVRPSFGPAAAPASRLKILVAGLDRDSRGPVEAGVRRALGSRPASETWTVSLVKLGARWSVTLQGGARTRSISLTADESGLEQAIRRAIDADATAPAQRSPAGADRASPAAAPAQERLVCKHCSGALLVVYESRAGEPKEQAPVACPHCWQINQVEIGAWAAAGRDYRCDKAS